MLVMGIGFVTTKSRRTGRLSFIKAYPLSIVAPRVACIIGRQRSSVQSVKLPKASSGLPGPGLPVPLMSIGCGDEASRTEGTHAKEELASGAKMLAGHERVIIKTIGKTIGIDGQIRNEVSEYRAPLSGVALAKINHRSLVGPQSIARKSA